MQWNEIRRTDIPSRISVQPRKDNLAILEPILWLALPDNHLLDLFGDRTRLFPLGSLEVGLTSRSGGSSQRMDFEKGMGGKEGDKPLADGSGSSEDTDLDFLLGRGGHGR